MSASARTIEVRGLVQGVGFRPFVWRLARKHGVAGWVRNRSGVVEIMAEGAEEDLVRFSAALSDQTPPRARVEAVSWRPQAPAGVTGFDVEPSEDEDEGDRLVSADIATCEACLRELFDPEDRRYRYPFINCTDCGPRFTIIEDLPYDRVRTSMRTFPLCEDCAREYEDPSDRRFHAEPVACPECGPQLTLRDPTWRPLPGDPIARAARLLRSGAIVAVKGLGGFHLACDATNEEAVAELRRRKHRPDKPFAVMVATHEDAERYFDLSAPERELLSSWRAPIVLVTDSGLLPPAVAPGYRRQGAMLPSTPLHHLLVREVGRPLVMTSGNGTDEPICTGNDEAADRLHGIADAFLVHDRDIVARYDDSVTRVWGATPVVLRRARGLAPWPVALGVKVRPTLAVGAELHGAFCLAEGTRAYLSQHIGDLDSDQSMAALADALARYRRLFQVEPEVVAHDLHPDLLSTHFAEATGLPTVAVQHHHAHIAAVMAEHRLAGPVLGVAFDGFGLGYDGTGWGGEFLVVDGDKASRAGYLRQVAQPGGDAAVRDPTRMALSFAADAGVLPEALARMTLDPAKATSLMRQIEGELNAPLTSSAGRLFDAVSALTGVCSLATYEGQPAMLLEQAADPSATFEYPFELDVLDGKVVIDTRPIIRSVVGDLRRRRGAGEIAGRFQRTMAAVILSACRLIRGSTGLTRVCLGGGVFQNDQLVSDAAARLSSCGFEVFVPHEVPVGDGGIALGQVLVAHARLGGG